MPYDKEELARRVREELDAEGEDERSIWQLAADKLWQLIDRIAKRLRRTREEIWEALQRLGGG